MLEFGKHLVLASFLSFHSFDMFSPSKLEVVPEQNSTPLSLSVFNIKLKHKNIAAVV